MSCLICGKSRKEKERESNWYSSTDQKGLGWNAWSLKTPDDIIYEENKEIKNKISQDWQ